MRQKVAKRHYWYGTFIIIPIVGLIIGILFVRKGILLRNRILLFIGGCGILLTAFFFIGGLLYSKYSDVGKTKRVQLARISLNEVMRDVEYYRIQFDVYPDSLEELKSVDRMVFIMDPLSQKGLFSTKLNYLHYKRLDSSHYTLFSAGLDRIPNTDDDVYPYIADSQKSGLVKIK